MCMHQTAVYLREEQQQHLRDLSGKLGRSEAELLREGVDLVWAHYRDPIGACELPVVNGAGELAERTDELLDQGFGTSA